MADSKGVFDNTFDNLKSIIDSATSFTPEGNDIDKKEIDVQEQISKDLINQRYLSDTRDRKWLAEWATTVVSIWLFFVLIIILSNHSHIHLSDSVLNVLLGTTTLNVLGLSFIVLRGHFNSSK